VPAFSADPPPHGSATAPWLAFYNVPIAREEDIMAARQRIRYVPLEKMTPEMRAEMERCAREGTPRPESSAVRAHVPACFWSFANSWRDIFHNGVCEHAIKELARLYVSRAVNCEFCGNQRSVKAVAAGALGEHKVDELLDFEKSPRYSEREKAALAYAEAITWRLDTDDAFWERMHRHFTEPELVELGCFIALTMGQQSWLRLLNIEHHEVMAGTAAALAPGFETAEALAKSKSRPDYWARKGAARKAGAA
jgi:alkylhydroperoxidase family enzyme